MEIHFADPGFDWLPVFIALGVPAVVLVAAGVAGLVYLCRSRAYSEADEAAWYLFVGSGLLAIPAFFIGLIVSAVCYGNAQDVELYRALEEAGFSAIVIDNVPEESGDAFSAQFKGKPYIGVIENLEYPEGFTYLVTEAH